MGCSASKLDDEEVVQLCKDRKNFIKHAVERRTQFASAHLAYLQSLRRVSIALHNYVEGDEGHDFFYDSFSTPPFNTVKKSSPEIIGIPLKAFPQALPSSDEVPSRMVHYFRSGGNAAVSIEERPPSPETARIDSYFSMDHYGIDGFFTTQESPMHPSFFSSSPYTRTSYPPRSPPPSQWDSFWNPFPSLDAHGYSSQNSPNQLASDDDMAGLRRVREEEGIPDLEVEGEEPTKPKKVEERGNVNTNYVGGEASADCPDKDKVNSDTVKVKGCHSHGVDRVEVSQTQNAAELLVGKEQDLMGNGEATEETPGFTIYLNRRPNSMVEVATSIEKQFMRICDSAHVVSVILEASRAQYSLNSHELTASKMLNPIALIRAASLRSTSFRSTSSRFFLPSSTSKDDGYETSSDFSEESCMTSGSHQSTLDRLYEWEKKLYKEVKSGERIRIAYEKKCKQLTVNGEDPSVTGKTRATARDLHTQMKVSVHSVETISKRIETLRDEELHPQLMELIQGLVGMWRAMADCHHIQKRTIDEAKLLLATTPKVLLVTLTTSLSRAAANLESELRNWRSCFNALVAAQRSYVRALLDWLIRCGRAPEDDARLAARSTLSPPRCSGAPPIFELCMHWSRALDGVTDARALDGLDFFASGIASVAEQQREAEEAARRSTGGGGSTAGAVVAGDEHGGGGFGPTAPEKMVEVAVRVLCAGMSVALGAMTEFSAASRDGYEELHAAASSGGRKGGEAKEV